MIDVDRIDAILSNLELYVDHSITQTTLTNTEAISIASFDSLKLTVLEQNSRITKTGTRPGSGLCLGGAEGT
jgi:hypothetical protein